MNQPAFYKIPKWRDFQHYKDRSPPWIKLHFDLLTSETWLALDDASRVLAVACMLIASRNEGRIPAKPTYMQRVAYLSGPANFSPLLECGFLVVDDENASESEESASKKEESASNALSGCKQLLADASPETEQIQSKPPNPQKAVARFEQFWSAYPKKVGRGAAEKAFAKAHINGEFDSVLQALETQKRSEQWQKDGGQYIPNPATWLNQKRWLDGEPSNATRGIFEGVL